MKPPLVVVTSPLPGDALEMAEGRARIKVYRSPSRDEATLTRRLRRADGAITLLSDPVGGSVIKGSPRLRVISNYAVGTDNIDLESARKRGVVVTNTPDVLSEATADIAWTLILGTARRAIEGDRMVRRGRFKGWNPNLLLGMDIAGKTLGIVGMGRIGRATARRAPVFGMKVVYSQRKRLPASSEAALSARFLPLDELVKRADVVSLHCPLTPQTKHLFNRNRLKLMKDGAILVNTGRGALIDEGALVEALRFGKPAAAGLDVYEREPLLADGLTALSNVMLLPHLGSAGRETREEMARMAVSDCLAVIEGRAPEHPVG